MSENIYAVRTNQLRSRMQQEDLRAYLIPMNDFHGSEYIGEYFKTIAIKERINPKLHRQHLPVRFWKYMTEKQ